jgi:DNA-binding response OmpR family regulator
MAKILIVEDDEVLREYLAAELSANGYATECCSSGEDALQLLTNFHFDLIVQDWALPGISGEEVCRRFRRSGGQSPMIFLTGKGNIQFKENSFDAGADDYIVKPFEMRELLARVKAVLKRRPPSDSAILQVDDLVLNVEDRTITVGETVVTLRTKEISLLEFLMKNPNRVYSAQQLLLALWPGDTEVTTGAVRVWVKFIRDKLAEAGKPDLIVTVGKSGYTIRG